MANKKKKKFSKKAEQKREVEETGRKVNWQYIFDLITSVTAVVSIIISIITVSLMIKDRNAAYRPSILINPTQYNFSWDQHRSLDWINSIVSDKKTENSMEVNADGSITGQIKFPISVIGDGFEQFTAVNVGVGTANQVSFKWHDSNIYNLNNCLIKCDKEKDGFLTIDNSIAFNYNDRIIQMELPSNMSLMYMLPEASESYNLPLPSSYYYLIQEIIMAGGKSEDIPDLILSVSYKDIQGKDYADVYLISVKIQLFEETITGAGSATFQLVPLFKK